jgi:alpha/beta superfamily hydrolase
MTIMIPGPVGQLEALLDIPAIPTDHAVVICHPHPLYGGTMHNKVITMLAKVCTELGFMHLRFNYRGIGASEGEYGHLEGEVLDALAAIDWLAQHHPYKKLWLFGFSFGSYIAARASIVRSCEQLLTVAPAVQHAQFDTLPPITCPWTILQGEKDEIVPAQLVVDFAQSREEKPELILLPDSGHFFHGHLTLLKETLLKHFQSHT